MPPTNQRDVGVVVTFPEDSGATMKKIFDARKLGAGMDDFDHFLQDIEPTVVKIESIHAESRGGSDEDFFGSSDSEDEFASDPRKSAVCSNPWTDSRNRTLESILGPETTEGCKDNTERNKSHKKDGKRHSGKDDKYRQSSEISSRSPRRKIRDDLGISDHSSGRRRLKGSEVGSEKPRSRSHSRPRPSSRRNNGDALSTSAHAPRRIRRSDLYGQMGKCNEMDRSRRGSKKSSEMDSSRRGTGQSIEIDQSQSSCRPSPDNGLSRSNGARSNDMDNSRSGPRSSEMDRSRRSKSDKTRGGSGRSSEMDNSRRGRRCDMDRSRHGKSSEMDGSRRSGRPRELHSGSRHGGKSKEMNRSHRDSNDAISGLEELDKGSPNSNKKNGMRRSSSGVRRSSSGMRRSSSGMRRSTSASQQLKMTSRIDDDGFLLPVESQMNGGKNAEW